MSTSLYHRKGLCSLAIVYSIFTPSEEAVFMEAYLSRLPGRRRRASLTFFAVSVMFGLSLLFSACGSNGGSTPASSVTPSVAKPTGLITAGTLTVGSDTTYPPQEFEDPASQQYVGFDVDLITAIAQRMGLRASIQKANFDTIIDDLSAKRYDVVISALTINSDREKKADFVPYFNAGQSLLVEKGNPGNIKTVDDLCGKTVGVQSGTVELDTLNATNTDYCKAKGKSDIQMTVLTDQTDVIQLLADKRVVATFQDSPVTDYYLQQNSSQFEVAGSIIKQAPEGIAVRKGDASMLKAIQDGFKAVKADGTYDSLFTKWHLNTAQKVALANPALLYA